VAFCVYIACFLLRYVRVQQAYDIFTDEVTYARIAQSVAIHHTVAYFGEPFYLHPPLVFVEQAIFLDAFHIQGSIFSVVYALRVVGILFASGSAVLMLRLGTRLGGTLVGVTAALLLCLDPLLIRFDGRVFLEAPTFFWVLVGLTALHRSLTAGEDGGGTGRLSGFAAGLAFACAFASNEIALPLIAVPLGLGVALGWPFPRRRVLPVAASSVLLSSIYPIVLVVDGRWHDLVQQQLAGVLRLVGVDQATGFNKPGAPALTSRILADLHTYAAVYAVLGLAVLPTLWLLRRGTPAQRLAALVAGSSYLMIGYQIAFGTLEEQMFYYVEVPAILMLSLGFGALVHRARDRTAWSRRRSFALALGMLAAVSFLAFDASAWVQVHTTPDAALERTIEWLDNHVPSGTRVAPLVDTSQLLVSQYQVFFTQTPSQIRAERPAYVLTSSLQVTQGYGFASPSLISWLWTHAKVTKRYQGRTYGTITVWRLPYPTATARPPGFGQLGSTLPRVPIGEG
jgi:4-amino-4-deoxy-L-arabinose transferase-like glycosyltransferase